MDTSICFVPVFFSFRSCISCKRHASMGNNFTKTCWCDFFFVIEIKYEFCNLTLGECVLVSTALLDFSKTGFYYFRLIFFFLIKKYNLEKNFVFNNSENLKKGEFPKLRPVFWKLIIIILFISPSPTHPFLSFSISFVHFQREKKKLKAVLPMRITSLRCVTLK